MSQVHIKPSMTTFEMYRSNFYSLFGAFFNEWFWSNKTECAKANACAELPALRREDRLTICSKKYAGDEIKTTFYSLCLTRSFSLHRGFVKLIINGQHLLVRCPRIRRVYKGLLDQFGCRNHVFFNVFSAKNGWKKYGIHPHSPGGDLFESWATKKRRLPIQPCKPKNKK